MDKTLKGFVSSIAIGWLLVSDARGADVVPLVPNVSYHLATGDKDQYKLVILSSDYTHRKRMGFISVKSRQSLPLIACLDTVRMKLDNQDFAEARYGRCLAYGQGYDGHGLHMELPKRVSTVSVNAKFSDGAVLSQVFQVLMMHNLEPKYDAYHQSHHGLMIRRSLLSEGDTLAEPHLTGNAVYVEIAPDTRNVTLRVDQVRPEYLRLTAACSSIRREGVNKINIKGRVGEREDQGFENWLTMDYVKAPLNAQITVYLDMSSLRSRQRNTADSKATVNIECVKGGRAHSGKQQTIILQPPAREFYDDV